MGLKRTPVSCQIFICLPSCHLQLTWKTYFAKWRRIPSLNLLQESSRLGSTYFLILLQTGYRVLKSISIFVLQAMLIGFIKAPRVSKTTPPLFLGRQTNAFSFLSSFNWSLVDAPAEQSPETSAPLERSPETSAPCQCQITYWHHLPGPGYYYERGQNSAMLNDAHHSVRLLWFEVT